MSLEMFGVCAGAFCLGAIVVFVAACVAISAVEDRRREIELRLRIVEAHAANLEKENRELRAAMPLLDGRRLVKNAERRTSADD